jgi:hypothetical protein
LEGLSLFLEHFGYSCVAGSAWLDIDRRLCGIEDQGPKHDDWQTTRESHLIEKPD